jgi:hypothetical protein
MHPCDEEVERFATARKDHGNQTSRAKQLQESVRCLGSKAQNCGTKKQHALAVLL